MAPAIRPPSSSEPPSVGETIETWLWVKFSGSEP